MSKQILFLMKHEYRNMSSTTFEASWNVKIASLAFLAALTMHWEWACIKLQQKHNREVVKLRNWRFRNGWRMK